MQRWPRAQRSIKGGSAKLVHRHTRLYRGVGTTTSQARERSFYRGNITKQTRPRPDHHGQAAEVMLSMSPPRPRVDEKLPSSAPETSQRRRGSFVTSWCIVAPTRGSGDAAGAAHAHRAAAAHPARRRGEERPHPRRHDGVEAPLRHCACNARAAPPASCATLCAALGLPCFVF